MRSCLAFSTFSRLLAALLLVVCTATPMRWAYLYAVSAVIPAVGRGGRASAGAAPCRGSNWISSFRPCARVSTSPPRSASQILYDDIDKTMLARLSTVESAAIYAVAYRFVEAAMLPIRSVAAATYPEFFRQGMHGVTSAFGIRAAYSPAVRWSTVSRPLSSCS